MSHDKKDICLPRFELSNCIGHHDTRDDRQGMNFIMTVSQCL